MFRAYRVRATGQWCGPLMEDGHFADDGTERAFAMAATLGLPPGSLEVVDSDTDPRTGTLIEDPNVTPPPVPAAPPPFSRLLAALAADPNLSPATKAAIAALRG